jgi:hypothetical protein
VIESLYSRCQRLETKCASQEAELERIREVFGEFFPRIPIQYAEHPSIVPPGGTMTALTFRSPIVNMELSPEALYCAQHPEDLVKSALRRQALQFADRVVEEICRAAPPPRVTENDKGWDVT